MSRASEDLAGDSPAGLISLRLLRGALRRRAWILCFAAAAGLALSGGLTVEIPPAAQAATTVLVINNPDEDPGTQMQGNLALAQSGQVATAAARSLGLHESIASFARSYTVSAITDRLLEISVTAASDSEAVPRANVLAAEFLVYRAKLLEVQQKLDVPALGQEAVLTRGQLAAINAEISNVSAQPPSPARKTALHNLLAQSRFENAALGGTIYTVQNYPVLTLSMVKGSQVLDRAAPIPPSRRHRDIIVAIAGLVGGLAIGLTVVLVEAVTSMRLRRRVDVARALGTPVDISVGSLRMARVLAGRGGVSPRGQDMQRLVAYLRSAVPPGRPAAAAALAVVPVDNARVAALSLVSLAASCAREGRQVLLADLSSGALAAGLLGASAPGIRSVAVADRQVVVAVPNARRVPVGPVSSAERASQPRRPDQELSAAYQSADLLLTLTDTLDPAVGGEYLASWATDAVVVVTAGRSSARKLRATGELIRQAGTQLTAAVLIGADRTDESPGCPSSSAWQRRPSASLRRPAKV